MSDTSQQPRGGLARDGWDPMLIAPAAPAAVHVDDNHLLHLATRAEQKHVAECGWCRERQRIAQLSVDGADGTDEEFEQALQGEGWEDSFRRASVGVILPGSVRRLMTVRPVPDSVAAGQLWRLTWKERHLLAAVIAVDGWHVQIAPVTTDGELADELTLLVPADHSPVDVELAIRVRQRTVIPLFVLDRYLGALPPTGREQTAAADALAALARAHRTDSSASGGVTVGHRLFAEDADAIAFADAVAEEAAWFAGAACGLHYVPGEESQAGEGDASLSTTTLPELIADAGLTLTQLVERTSLTPGRLVDLRRGASASEAEVLAVASATNTPVDRHLAPVDAASFHIVMAEVSTPQRRAARAAWTRLNVAGGDPDDPTELVQWLLHERVAARSVPDGQLTDDVDATRAYWRDRVAMVLADLP